MIYYSGHGQIKANQAYWIPKDGSKEWGNGDWVNIQELDIYFREIKAHHLAVMVDSCFVGSKFKGNNILDRLTEEDVLDIYEENLIDKLDLRARVVLSSGSTGQVSDTAAGTNHSRFALALLNILNNVPIPISMTSVAFNINNAFTGTFQKPLLYYPDTWQHGGGDFIFIQKDK